MILVGLLFLFPALLIAYRIAVLNYPLFPTAPGDSWFITFTARLSKGPGGHVQAALGLPVATSKLTILNEEFYSGELGFGLSREGPNRFAIFSGQLGSEDEFVRYRGFVITRAPASEARTSPLRLEQYPRDFEKADIDLAERMTKPLKSLPVNSRVAAVAKASVGDWEGVTIGDDDLSAWRNVRRRLGADVSTLGLFRSAGLHARLLQGIRLTRSVQSELVTVLRVWNGSRWVRIDMDTGEVLNVRPNLLVLARGGAPALEVREGTIADPRWDVSELILNNWRLHFERILRSSKLLDSWSFFHLPQEFQETFRILLLVPIGALLISILRNFVGFPTFGVFMPVLMALAFRSTGPLYGLAIFTGVVGIGYFLRNALDNMRLLLVPRLSVMLTVVISVLTVMALLGNKVGMREFMAVGLLPFVILTMVIERFFVMVEESGIRTAIKTALGSAAVALITFAILHFEQLQLTFFIYPELLFAVAACQLLMGRYTGYRLSELVRFKSFRSAP